MAGTGQEATVVVDDGAATVIVDEADTVVAGPDLGEAESETTEDAGPQDAGEAGETTAVTMAGDAAGGAGAEAPGEAVAAAQAGDAGDDPPDGCHVESDPPASASVVLERYTAGVMHS